MSFIEAASLKDFITPIAAEMAGHGVTYEVAKGTEMNEPKASVDLKLNEESLRRAQMRVEHSQNPVVAQAAAYDMPTPSPSMIHIAGQASKTENHYAAMVARTGANYTLQRSPALGMRPNYRSAMVRDMRMLAQKNPLIQPQVRRLQEVRHLFRMIAARKDMTMLVTKQMLPQPVAEKVTEAEYKADPAKIAIDRRSIQLMPALKNHLPSPTPKKKRQWALDFDPSRGPSPFPAY